MKHTVFYTVVAGVLLMTACAARNSNIIIDPSGVQMDAYQADLAQCQKLSKQVQQKVGGGALGGAMVGGLVGAAIGSNKTARKGASIGAVSGAARGARTTNREKRKVTKNCLRNRGYVVLN